MAPGCRVLSSHVLEGNFSDRRDTAASRELLNFTTCVNRQYAEQHGCRHTLSTEPVGSNRHPAWDRVTLLLRSLAAAPTTPVLWVDSDVALNDHSTSFDDWIALCERHSTSHTERVQLVIQSTWQHHARGDQGAYEAWDQVATCPQKCRFALNFCCSGTCTCAVGAPPLHFEPTNL